MLIFAYQFSLILLAKCTACHVYFFYSEISRYRVVGARVIESTVSS